MVMPMSNASICKAYVDVVLRVKYVSASVVFCDSPGSYKSRLCWLQGYLRG